ncbi:MAG: hypothetical protein ACSLEM_05405 [Candidatus Malihini olakiniferum]
MLLEDNGIALNIVLAALEIMQ